MEIQLVHRQHPAITISLLTIITCQIVRLVDINQLISKAIVTQTIRNK